MTKPPRIYWCDHCGGMFEAAWSEEEAVAEAKTNWGDLPKEDREQVCDLCYRKFMAWMAGNQGNA